MEAVRMIKIGLVQSRATVEPEDNIRRTMAAIRAVAARGAQIVSTQELFCSRYFCQHEDARYFDLAEPIPGPTTTKLQDLARELQVVIVGSLFEERAAGLYHNTAVIIDADGALLGTYRKMHIPDDPGFSEKYYFAPGDQGFRVWNTRYARLGVLVCWDQWFPEAARLTAMQGAEILFYPTAIGWLPGERDEGGLKFLDAWRTIQRSHAIANGCYVAAVNRVGREEGGEASGFIDFWGGSFVADPLGQVVAEASMDDEQSLIASIDLGQITTARIEWPFFRDRRIDAYHGLTQRLLDQRPSRVDAGVRDPSSPTD